MEQADIVELLLKQLGIKRVKIIAHDMGTSVTCELLARRERQLLGFNVQSVLLMNGSVYIDLAQLTPSQNCYVRPLRSFCQNFAQGDFYAATTKNLSQKDQQTRTRNDVGEFGL